MPTINAGEKLSLKKLNCFLPEKKNCPRINWIIFSPREKYIFSPLEKFPEEKVYKTFLPDKKIVKLFIPQKNLIVYSQEKICLKWKFFFPKNKLPVIKLFFSLRKKIAFNKIVFFPRKNCPMKKLTDKKFTRGKIGFTPRKNWLQYNFFSGKKIAPRKKLFSTEEKNWLIFLPKNKFSPQEKNCLRIILYLLFSGNSQWEINFLLEVNFLLVKLCIFSSVKTFSKKIFSSVRKFLFSEKVLFSSIDKNSQWEIENSKRKLLRENYFVTRENY